MIVRPVRTGASSRSATATILRQCNISAMCSFDPPLGRVVGQIGNKYIIAYKDDNMVVVDQHAAHERITYGKLRTHKIKTQPLLAPIVIDLREEDVVAVMRKRKVSPVHCRH